jgi:hypothetical protein
MSGRIDRLGSAAAEYRDPLRVIDWSAADPSLPWLPPAILGLDELPISLTKDVRLRFSRIEFSRLCAAGLWVEGLLIGRLSKMGYPASRFGEAQLVLHEIREEAGHGLMFLEMIRRAELDDADLLGPTRLLSFIARVLPPKSPEFWALVYVGESITDAFAVRALQQSQAEGEEICPLAREVLAFHHRDEARHIAAARTMLAARIDTMSAPRKAVFAAVLKRLLHAFLDATLYPTAASLAQLGVSDPAALARAIRSCPKRRAAVNGYSAPALRFLKKHGLGDDLFRGGTHFAERPRDELV